MRIPTSFTRDGFPGGRAVKDIYAWGAIATNVLASSVGNVLLSYSMKRVAMSVNSGSGAGCWRWLGACFERPRLLSV